jgi:hypothetical protein
LKIAFPQKAQQKKVSGGTDKGQSKGSEEKLQ